MTNFDSTATLTTTRSTDKLATTFVSKEFRNTGLSATRKGEISGSSHILPSTTPLSNFTVIGEFYAKHGIIRTYDYPHIYDEAKTKVNFEQLTLMFQNLLTLRSLFVKTD